MEKLKRCPFCGGEAKICGYYFIQCVKCGSSTLTHTNRELTINTWNARIPTVEAKPVVHREWESDLDSCGWINHTCSNCGYEKLTDIHVSLGWNFCPNCGCSTKKE